MKDLKEKYNQIVSERQGIIEQINALAENEFVKEYFELRKINDKLNSEQEDLYKQIKVSEYSSCSHIWVNTLHDFDRLEGRSYDYCGCVKCGLDEMVLHLMESYRDPNFLTLNDRIMYDFMKTYDYQSGIDTGIMCDLDLAKNIYEKIIKIHPDADDETIVKYLRVAIDSIKDAKVNDERKRKQKK